jgi:hypothetical protein
VATAQQKVDDGRLNWAAHLIDKAEADLHRTLSAGERRDLLADNTKWDRDFIHRAVDYLTS